MPRSLRSAPPASSCSPPRQEGARGLGVALLVGTTLPLHDFDVVRFGVDLGVAVDVQLARNILVAGYASLGASARYHLEDPAFQSVTSGAGVRVPITGQLDFLADLWGRVDVPGGPVITAETSAGLRVHLGHVFITGSAGTSLTAPSLLLRLTVQAGAGDGLLLPTERDDVEPPEDACFETRCTPQQRAAVRRALLPRLEALRKQLIALAGLIELRIRERAGPAAQREAVHVLIDNDLSIPSDAGRKRELSIRFLLAAFAQRGVAIDRAMAAQLLDDTGWRVHVDRRIDEPRADYFTFDLPRLGAAYATRLRWNAERLKDAMAALRAADAETTQILLDIARGHANGLIGVANGLLDLPLAPINLARFALGRETIHGLGRIPDLEYKSDWGREFGHAMELGVMLGTMTAPGASVFAGLGRTVAPAAARLVELPALAWNGLPVGRFLQTLLVKWMQGSVVAVKAHAAGELEEIVHALATGRVRLPDGTYRPMSADDFEQLVFAFIQDAALVKSLAEGKRGMEEAEETEAVTSFAKGRLGERIARAYLEDQYGYKNLRALQNGSGQGVDLFTDERPGELIFIEVKATEGNDPPGLNPEQRDMLKFVESRVADAAKRRGQWKNAPQEVVDDAKRLEKVLAAQGSRLILRGRVVRIRYMGSPKQRIEDVPW